MKRKMSNAKRAKRYAKREFPKQQAGQKVNPPSRSCIGKIRHESRRAAKAARDASAREYGRTMDYYRCAWCGGWHVCKGKSKSQGAKLW